MGSDNIIINIDIINLIILIIIFIVIITWRQSLDWQVQARRPPGQGGLPRARAPA
jgi:hypothetical protein